MNLAAIKLKRLSVVAAAALLLFPTAWLLAAGQSVRLPPGPKYPSGLTLEIDGRGIDANGYRPFRVTVATAPPGGPVLADRQVRVVLAFYRHGSQSPARVSQVIELPEGSASASATMLVPQLGSWQRVAVETYEGGVELEDLSAEHLGWQTTSGWNWTEARPALLVIDSHVKASADRLQDMQAFATMANDASPSFDLPDVRALISLFPDDNNSRPNPGGPLTNPANLGLSQKISDTALLSMLSLRSWVQMLPPAELPERWIELSQYDVAVISLADLQAMAKSHPKRLAALRDWASTGPLLLVYGVGEKFPRLKELESLLELPPLPPQAGLAELCGWEPPDEDAPIHISRDQDETGVLATQPSGTPPGTGTLEELGAQRARKELASSDARPFVTRRAATGRVVAIASETPFPGQFPDWNWIFATVDGSHWQWFKRTGFSLHRTNKDYWQFLIPGVGQAPVFSFLILVSLFAVVIGPLNFFLLGRARRLYLLLITVPFGAVVVTLGLFAFALVSDGLRMRLRARSYADLDQTKGRAAVWSRQSYYAGIAPSRGLRFPDDTTVFPLANQPGASSNDKSTLLVWDGDQQLRGGYLTSRTATQFVTTRATTTSVKLDVKENASAGGPPTISNGLESRVNYLLLFDSGGNYFSGGPVRDKATVELKSIDLPTAQAAMQRLATSVKPEVPAGFGEDIRDDNIFSIFGIRRYRYGTSDFGAGDPLMNTSLLEHNLAALTGNSLQLTTRSYIAILDRSPLVITGAGPINEEASFHVIRGRY